MIVDHADFDIPFGAVVHDTEGGCWVFVGKKPNTRSIEYWFAKKVEGRAQEPWAYNACFPDTLISKFPDIARWKRGKVETTYRTLPQ